ncbi:MAG: FG-GAP-like repeat-containing protein [Gammaproteobacteria bacterium]|jgi:Flp pilus assembly protein TadD
MTLTTVLLALVLVLTACSDSVDDREQSKGKPADTFSPPPAAIEANNRGVGLMGQFQYAAAEAAFARLVKAHPQWLDAQVNLAIATLNRQQEGDDTTALGIVERVLGVDPDHLRAHYVAGLLRLYAADTAQALVHFKRVTEADPKDAYAAYYLGQCLAQQGKSQEALVWYRRSMALDPYLRSSYYGAFQMLRNLNQREEARALMRVYQRLEQNPRARLAEFKYTRMGPRGEAVAIGLLREEPSPPPSGRLFSEGEPLILAAPESLPLKARHAERQASLTAADINGDGRLDVFIPDALAKTGRPNLLLAALSDGSFSPQLDHPLAQVKQVNAALWGDFDNDGLLDVYLLRRGPNQLWRQSSLDQWMEVTALTQTAGGNQDSVGGSFLDADHDGDLDLFVVNRNGPNELLNNNRDGTFQEIGKRQGIAGDGRESRQALPVDLDGDRDVDLIVINAAPPHEIYLNDRLWAYRPAPGLEHFRHTPLLAAVAGDADANGQPEIYTANPHGELQRWQPDASGIYRPQPLGRTLSKDPPWAGLAIQDLNGDGELDLLSATPAGWAAGRLSGKGSNLSDFIADAGNKAALVGFTPALLEPASGPAVIARDTNGGIRIWHPGSGRHPFLALTLSGMDDPGQSMRSNASGIGARIGVRVGARWTRMDSFLDHSGPGQGRQPLAVGLGGAAQADFIAIDWSDGVYQTELGLTAGRLHRVAEVERQLSSCPVLFAWDGTGYRFVTDLLGVAGIGFALGPPGQYATPRPWEHLLLPSHLLQPKAARLILKITEPMEEIAYLDGIRLHAYSIPPQWQLVVDERMAIQGPQPSGAAYTYRQQLQPNRAVNERGQMVTAAVIHTDGQAAPPGKLDRRFVGRLEGEHRLTLEFPAALDGFDAIPLLVVDGWVEYPYSQTMFAAWQAGASFDAPTLEARDADGRWRVLQEEFGYPAGMPRRMAYPLTELPPGTRALRLRTNMEVYWDRIVIALAEPLPKYRQQLLELRRAELRKVGFPKRTTGAQRRPHYDYSKRQPFWDTRYMAGFYTRLGPVEALVEAVDGAYAIIAPGEEVHLEFRAPVAPLPPDWQRIFVLEAHGATKDMDLYTRDGDSVDPLPATRSTSSKGASLQARYQTRYLAGH